MSSPSTLDRTRNIPIFGATGTIGSHITRAIVAAHARGDFTRLGIFTSPATLESKAKRIAALKAQGVEVFAGSIESAHDVTPALRGFDTVVSCVGRPVIQTQLALVPLLERHPDVKRFFPSEYGTDIEYGPTSAGEPPHQQKLKVRAALKETTQLAYTYIVTGPYGDADHVLYLSANDPAREELGTYDVRRRRAVVAGDGTGRISLTTMRDVGSLVVAALRCPIGGPETRNRALRVNSFSTTPNEIVAEFERQMGSGPWEVGFTSLQRLRELEAKAYEAKDPRAGVITLRRIWAEGGTLYAERENGVIGMEEGVDSLESAVRQAIEVQTRS